LKTRTVDEVAATLSRELVLICSHTGVCVRGDTRAEAVLGAVAGQTLESLADQGSRSKARALFEACRKGPVEHWELCLSVAGEPKLYSFDAETCGDDVVLVGCALTPALGKAVASYQAALGDLAVTHRETAREKSELERLHRELSDSHKGLLSLHSELDEKNDTLRRSSDVKTRLVANVSHEFRTPINSILGLSRLLLERVDGDLTDEQQTQVEFIRNNAETLRALIDDVLDLSKIEAGKVPFRPRDFEVSELFAALRGTMAPYPRSEQVELTVECGEGIPPMTTDDAKVAQILRNLVSNALKFTEAGSVRVTAIAGPNDSVSFRVTDSGCGIAHADQDRIFEEFAQIDRQGVRVRGTGLGLAVSRRLASILGGSIAVSSELGRGSTFTLSIPRVHAEAVQMQALVARSRVLDPRRAPVLVVEDDRQTMFLYEKYLTQSGFQVIPARTTDEARAEIRRARPAAIVLDVMLETESTWSFLREVKEDAETRDIPVMVVTVVDSSHKARALGADEFWLKPIDPDRMRRKLSELARRGPVSVLVVDDDETSRYLVRKLLADTPYVLHEAANAQDGVRVASEKLPQVILLDFVLGEASAFDVIDELKANPDTRNIPIIIQTAKTLDSVERARLARDASAILSKQSLSRELAITRIREALENAGLREGGNHVR